MAMLFNMATFVFKKRYRATVESSDKRVEVLRFGLEKSFIRLNFCCSLHNFSQLNRPWRMINLFEQNTPNQVVLVVKNAKQTFLKVCYALLLFSR